MSALQKAAVMFLFLLPVLVLSQTTEKFNDEVNGSTSFSEGGLTFNATGYFEVYVRSDFGLDDNYFIENINHPVDAGGVVGSFTNSSNNFHVNSLYFTPVQGDNYTLSLNNNIIIRGKLEGDTKFTHTIYYNEINNSPANNYYTYVNLSSYSAIAIDELEFEIEPYGTNTTKYLEIDDFMFTPAASAPGTQAENVSFTGTTASQTSISWTRGNGDNCVVFVKAASSGTASPEDQETYTANSAFGSGEQIASTGWYCVYNGSSTGTTITGLHPGTTYRVHVCEYNQGAGSELYLTSSGTDNPDNVTANDASITFINGAGGTLNFVQSNAAPPENNWLCGQFSLEADVTGSTLNSVTVTLGGTYDAGDLASAPFQIYAAGINDFSSASALGSSVTDPGAGSDITFSGLNDAIPASTRYYWVTADISATATGDDTMNGTVDAAGDVSITSGALSGSSSYGRLNAGSDASLPVSLSSFSARCEGRTVVLYWVTESETDNLGFILERSVDNQTWSILASCHTNEALKGQGSTSSKTEYAFTDEEVQSETTYYYRLSDAGIDGETTLYSSLSITMDALPKLTGMESAYPNPFNPQTYIAYHLAADSKVTITVFDMLGRRIKDLFEGRQYAGNYHVYWNGKDANGFDAASGTYIIRMQTENTAQIQKVIFMR